MLIISSAYYQGRAPAHNPNQYVTRTLYSGLRSSPSLIRVRGTLHLYFVSLLGLRPARQNLVAIPPLGVEK